LAKKLFYILAVIANEQGDQMSLGKIAQNEPQPMFLSKITAENMCRLLLPFSKTFPK
jgi:hypothetical protein